MPKLFVIYPDDGKEYTHLFPDVMLFVNTVSTSITTERWAVMEKGNLNRYSNATVLKSEG
jgi:hypothetical protein